MFDILSSLGEESADIIANNEVLYKLEKTYTYTPLNSIATGLSFHFIGLDSDYKFEDSLEQENFYNTSSTGKTINELTVHQGDINDVYMDEDGYQDYGNGTILNPYKIAINKEFVEINKNYNMGDMITIDSNFYEIVATVSMPNYLYPVHS
ncbi:MAG: hypothetical protein DRP42_04285 [Tenericutes bacterium]|nr:MAG: hypothetical protein DRP42_04285 [Mycoplasmatota bacterium]